MQQAAPIDWAGLVTAAIALMSALTLAITLWNKSHINQVKDSLKEIDGNLQAQMDTKEYKQ